MTFAAVMISKSFSLFSLSCFGLLFCLFTPHITNAQIGAIKGKVTDNSSKEPLIAVNVVIKGTTIGASTDFDGNYLIRNLKPGNYTLIVSYISYQKQEKNVIVKEGETATLNFLLTPDQTLLDAVEIVAERTTHTENAVLAEMRESSQIISGISSQQIQRSADNNAAQVVSRVPGVTIVDNSFVMIRGLNQRYNNVMINGAFAPSSEPDTRAFSFDLIPANILDRMLIFKSGSAELPGDFAGGVIKISTKNTSDFDFTDISIGIGNRFGTSLNNFTLNQGITADWLAMGGKNRQLPNGFPANLQDANAQDRLTAGQSLPNNFGTNNNMALPDFKFGYNFAKTFEFWGTQASNVSGFWYSNSNQFLNIKRNRWTDDRAVSFDFNDEQIENEVRLTAISNFLFSKNAKTKYSWKNTFNQIGERSTIIRSGFQPQERQNDEYRNYAFQYLARSIFTSQFAGNHIWNNGKSNFDWLVGGSYVSRNEPDFRRFRSTRPIGSEQPFTLIDPPGATTFDAARFFSKLTEVIGMTSGNYSYRFSNKIDSASIKIMSGYYIEGRQRDFSARWMSYTYNQRFGDPQDKEQLLQLPIDQIFSPQNIKLNDGWQVQEGTNPSDAYDASSFLTAAYVTAAIPIKRFDINIGIRVEHFVQKLNSATQTAPVNVNNPTTDPMPFINISYPLDKRNMLRLAYSKTVNRPEFRELAPFLYYNFKYDVNYVGDPLLKSSSIHNIDFRWEMYPKDGETVTLGAFYKKFINPIETYVQSAGLAQQFKMGNAPEALNYGFELEFRKTLGKGKFWRDLTVLANASYIISEVNLGSRDTLSQDAIRPLQGQSPYVINLSAFYYNAQKKFSINVLYNVFGKRIFFVGNDQFPTVFEMPRHAIDLTASKKLSARFELKFTLIDLLNYRTLYLQDSDRNNTIDFNIDQNIMRFQRGSAASVSITYKLK